MNPADTSLRAQPSEPAAFTFQLSPEPPAVALRDASGGAAPRDQAILLDDTIDSAWFAAPGEAAEDDVGPDALAHALSDAPTQTPPPARALPMPARPTPAAAVSRAPAEPLADLAPAQGRAPTLPRPITIDDPLTDPPLPLTPTSGHQLSALLTAPSEEPAPVLREPEAVRVSSQLPQTKSLSFPADVRQVAAPERPLTPSLPPQAEPSASPEPAPTREPAEARREPAKAAERESTRVEGVAAVPDVAAAPAVPDVKDTSTFKVIGYALVAMAFSYIGMSALVAWLSDSNAGQPGTAPVATTAQAALTDVEASAEAAPPDAAEAPASAAPPGAAAEAPAAAPAKPTQVAEQLAIEDLPVPAGLALGADKGVLKLVTPDAHTLYVDGEFAGRGPVRIVPLAPGKHSVKTRFDGEEKSYEANVQAGRMTRVTISAAK